ncbi:hypothetical protein ACLOJK_007899 [Asimina triloba]
METDNAAVRRFVTRCCRLPSDARRSKLSPAAMATGLGKTMGAPAVCYQSPDVLFPNHLIASHLPKSRSASIVFEPAISFLPSPDEPLLLTNSQSFDLLLLKKSRPLD